MTDLLPCPFCGAQARDDGTFTHAFHCWLALYYAAKERGENVEAAWNRRATLAAPAAAGVSDDMIAAALDVLSAKGWSPPNGSTFGSDVRDALVAALRRAHQPGAEAGGWVACSERMPEPDVRVLVARRGAWDRIAYWNTNHGMRWWIDGCSPEDTENGYVTHWRPIPPPPPQQQQRDEG